MNIVSVSQEIPGYKPDLTFARYLTDLLDGTLTTITCETDSDVLTQTDPYTHDLLILTWNDIPRHQRFSKQIVEESDCSVLILKGDPPETLNHLLICSGGRPVAEPVIDTGIRIAIAAEAKVTLLYVANAVPTMYTGLDAMEQDISEFLSTDTPEADHLRESLQLMEEANLSSVLELRHGVAVDEIMRSNKRQDYDLIIVGASDAISQPHRLLFGNVTRRIIEEASCSVLVARSSSAT